MTTQQRYRRAQHADVVPSAGQHPNPWYILCWIAAKSTFVIPKTQRPSLLVEAGRSSSGGPMAEARALRNVRQDLAHARAQLARWREDGHYEQIVHWLARQNELIERFAVLSAQTPEESTA
jgi:hypothetical protein